MALELFGSSKVPSPAVVHVAVVPVTTPSNPIVSLAQIRVSAPASIVAEELMVIITESETAGHGPIGSSVVIVRVTPLVISNAVGVSNNFYDLAIDKVNI